MPDEKEVNWNDMLARDLEQTRQQRAKNKGVPAPLDLTFSILKVSGYPEFARAPELEHCAEQLDGMIRQMYPTVTNDKTRLELWHDQPYSVLKIKDGSMGETADITRFLVNFIGTVDGVEFELAYLPGRDMLAYIVNRKGVFD